MRGNFRFSKQKYALTFTSWRQSIKSTSSAVAISSTRPCLVANQRKPGVTVVGSNRIKSIGAVFIR